MHKRADRLGLKADSHRDGGCFIGHFSEFGLFVLEDVKQHQGLVGMKTEGLSLFISDDDHSIGHVDGELFFVIFHESGPYMELRFGYRLPVTS